MTADSGGFAGRDQWLETVKRDNAAYYDQYRGSVAGDLVANAGTLFSNAGVSIAKGANALTSLVTDAEYRNQVTNGIHHVLRNPTEAALSAKSAAQAWAAKPLVEQVQDVGELGVEVLASGGTVLLGRKTARGLTGSAERAAARRAVLNEKFGRTGNLDLDISVRGYLHAVETLDVSTPHDGAVFYSGAGNRQRAEAFVRAAGTTLESTPGGAWLDRQLLFKRLPPEQAILPWERLSERYAERATGSVNAFIDGASPRGVFNRIELPALVANPDVPVIIKNGVQPIRIK